MRKISLLALALLLSTGLTNNAYSLSGETAVAKAVVEFNKAIKGNIEAEVYFNDTTKLIKEKIISSNKAKLRTLALDLNFDNKSEKELTIYTDSKGSYLSSATLRKFDQKLGIYIPGSSLTFKDSFFNGVFNLEDFTPIYTKDFTLKLSEYKLKRYSKNLITYTSSDSAHNLDLLLRNGKIYALDYYIVDQGKHNTFLLFQYIKSSKKVSKPNLNFIAEEKLSDEVKNYVNNYNLIREAGPKMVASYLSALAGMYINKPGSELNTLFDELFNSLPESYKAYNPTVVTVNQEVKGVSFTLSDYEVCGYLELDEKKIITARRIFVDSTCY